MIIDWLEEWFKGVLIDGIIGNLSGLFDTVNTKVGEIAADVGATPQGWNSGIFNMIRNLSESVIIPIAGAILAFVMTYELIQMVTEKNNLHDIDTFMFFKWVFKTYAAVLIVTNTWNIVMGVFDAAQQVVNQSAGVIIGNTSIDIDSLVGDLQTSLEAMSLGGLIGLWFQSLFVGLTMNILSICIMLVVYGRMIEIYLVTSLGPIPLAIRTRWHGKETERSIFPNCPSKCWNSSLSVTPISRIAAHLKSSAIRFVSTMKRWQKRSPLCLLTAEILSCCPISSICPTLKLQMC